MDVNITIDEPRLANRQPFRKRLPLPPGKRFHIFFSYTNVSRDKLWVKRVIAILEKEYGFTCCDHERDFLPGTKIMDNIKDGVMNSEKVVVVFSKESIDSDYVSLEAEMAFKRSIEARKNLLIPILLDDCDVPEEYLLLTYIDAREGVEETTWWPKLMKSIEPSGEASRRPCYVEGKNVAAGKTFAITQLCSIETKFNFLRCRMETNSKYNQEQLRPEAFGVPDHLIRATNKDLLKCPEVVCRQKMSSFARISVVTGYLIFLLFLIYLVLGIYFFVCPSETHKPGKFIIACIFLFGPCLFTWRVYITVPVDLIRATNKDSLQSPGVVCVQIMSYYAIFLVVTDYLVCFAFLVNLAIWIDFVVYPSETYETGQLIFVSFFISCTCGLCHFTWRAFKGVPVDLIRATTKDSLQSPGVVCRQKMSFFEGISVVIDSLIFFSFLVNLAYGIYLVVYPSKTYETGQVIFVSIFISCTYGPCYFTWRVYKVPIGEQNPNSVHNKIIDYNRKLSKYDVMVTVVPGYMWKTASLIFYNCRFEPCKEYVIRHLVQEGSTNKTEHKDIPENEQMSASDDDSSLLFGAGKLIYRRMAKQSSQNVNEINPVMANVAEDVSDVAEDKPLLPNQGTENLDYEKKALELLMSCIPEYLHLVYANKLKHPREDRHGIEFMCLCQYLEEANAGLREAVKRA